MTAYLRRNTTAVPLADATCPDFAERFCPVLPELTGFCYLRLSGTPTKTAAKLLIFLVGAAGFEPATPAV